MLTIIKNTFREALAKKITIFYYSLFTLVILILLLFVNTDFFEGILGFSDKGSAVKELQVQFLTFPGGLNWMYTFVLIFCLISSSSFIPSLLEKGNIDLILSKPISRAKILLSKYFGAVIFVAFGLTYFLGISWLIISLKSGYWNFSFLFSIVMWSVSFAIMYSISVALGLITQSSVISILVNVFLLGLILPILSIRESFIFKIFSGDAVKFIFDFFYYVLPKPGEINEIVVFLISQKSVALWKGELIADLNISEPSWMSLITSLLFCVVLLSYSIYYFSKKDY